MMANRLIRTLMTRAPRSRKAIPIPAVAGPVGRRIEELEGRALPATFSAVGARLNLVLNTANESVGIISVGSAYLLTLTGDTWSGTDSATAAGNGTPTLTVTAGAFSSGIDLHDAAAGVAVNFNNNGTNSFIDSFDISLQNAAAGAISFNGNTSFTGSASLSASTTSSIVDGPGVSVSTVNGDLTFSANEQTIPTTGNLIGVDVGGTIEATGTGALSISGKGGTDPGGNQFGVFIDGGTISGGTTGTTVIDGNGGASSADDTYGLFLDSGTITSAGSAVMVTGTGGGSGSAAFCDGLFLQNACQITSGGGGSVTVTGTGGPGSGAGNCGIDTRLLGEITSGGSGAVTVTGTGGSGSGGGNIGLELTDFTITSGGGPVTVTGQGGSSVAGNTDAGVEVLSTGLITSSGNGSVTVSGTGGPGSMGGNIGVLVSSGEITSGGSGPVAVAGTGGVGGGSDMGVNVEYAGEITSAGSGSVTVIGTGATGTGNDNYGVTVSVSGSALTSGGGRVAVTGVGNRVSEGVIVQTGGAVSTASTDAPITITTDSLIIGIDAINGNGSIDSGTGPTTLQTRTAGTAVNLGGVESLTGSPLALGLSATEIEQITAGSLTIGDTSGGPIAISASITLPTVTNLVIITASGNSIAFTGSGSLNSDGGSVTLSTSGTGATTSTTVATDILAGAGTVSLTAGSGGLGASGSPLIVSGTALDATTTGNGDAYLSVTGAVTIDPTGLNAGTGTVGLGGGTFTLGGSNRIDSSAPLIVSGATLAIGANALTVSGLTLASGSITGSTGVLTSTNRIQTQSGSISAILTGTNGLTQSTSGTTLLSGDNTFTGGVTIDAGTLQLGSAGALNSASNSENAVAFGPGSTGTLSLDGNSIVVAALTSNATPGDPVVQNASGTSATLTVGNSASDSGTFAGVIQDGPGGGTLALKTVDHGTFTLTGTNTYTGATEVMNGTLLVNGDDAGATGAVSVGGAILNGPGTIGGTGTIGGVVTVNSGGTITGGVLGGVGTLTVGGLSFDGGTCAVDVNGNTSDTIQTAGAVNLADATAGKFTLNDVVGTPAVPTVLTLIHSTATAIQNAFSNLTQGEVGPIGGQVGVYSYRGGTGNDLTFRTVGTPTASPQQISVAEGSTNDTIVLKGTDPNTPPLSLTYTVTVSPTHGTLSGTAPNLTYTPSTGYFGTDSFQITVNNGTATSPAATVSLTIVGTPTAHAQTVTLTENTASAITLTGTDPNTPPRSLTYKVTAPPTHGALSGTAPNLTYTPSTGYIGPDSFQFTVTNGTATSPDTTVLLTIVGTPTANPQSVTLAGGTASAITLTGTDPNTPPLPLTYKVTAPPTHGALSGTAPNLTYTPAPGYVGTDSFQFTVTNGTTTSPAATVSLVVKVVNPAPAPLLIGGQPNGTVAVETMNSSGQYTLAETLTPFGPLTTDIRTAVGDVNGDGIPDYIFATGPGTPFEVTVLSGAPGNAVLVSPFDPFLPAPPEAQTGLFTAGGFVSAGDFLGNGRDQIVVSPDQAGGPRVAIYDMNGAATAATQPYTAVGVNTQEINPGSGLTRINNFLSVNASFRGGARTAVGDLNGDGVPDLAIAAGYGGGPAVLVINGAKAPTTDGFTASDDLIGDFFAFNSTLRDGAYLAIGDVLGNGQQDLILGPGVGGPSELEVLSGSALLNQGAVAALANPVAQFTPSGLGADGAGLRVAVVPTGNGNQVNVAAATGRGRVGQVQVYPGENFTASGEPGGSQLIDPFGITALADGVFVG